MTPVHLAFMVLINLIWGFALVAAKVSMEHFPPLLFAALRFSLIVLVLLPYLKIHKGKMRDVLIIALCAGPVGFGFFFAGLAVSNASVTAVIGQLGVPISTVLSVMFLGEVIGWKRGLGIGLAFLGVMIISFDPTVFHFINGVILVVISSLIGAIGTIFQRRIKNVGVFEMQAWVAVAAAPLMIAASLALESHQWQVIESATALNWAGIFYVAFASSLVGHAGIYYLLQRYEVTQTAPLTLLAPIFTVFFAVTILDEQLSTRMIIGALVALSGVLIVSIREKKIVDTGP